MSGRMKIKKGDTVEVIAGKDKGKRGKVLRVEIAAKRVVVERVAFIKRHTKPNPRQNVKGGIVQREAPIPMANVMIVSPDSGKLTRVGFKSLEDGRKVRFAKTDGAILDQ